MNALASGGLQGYEARQESITARQPDVATHVGSISEDEFAKAKAKLLNAD